jgi:hypothetical protein
VTLQVLAFGAGVQSTALALLALNRDPRLRAVAPDLDMMVFSDPGSESEGTYALVERVAELARESGVPLYRATYQGDRESRLADSLMRDERFSTIPMFSESDGKPGQMMRACTRDYKIRPIAGAIRKHLGVDRMPKGQMVDIWLGISVDEVQRAKPEQSISWQRRVFPLLDMRWRRSDCAKYLEDVFGEPVGRSACVFCPYHGDKEWTRLYEAGGKDWAHAVEVDEAVRDMQGRGGIRSPCFLHRSLRPLADLPFLDSSGQVDLWGSECDGVCGL